MNNFFVRAISLNDLFCKSPSTWGSSVEERLKSRRHFTHVLLNGETQTVSDCVVMDE